MPKENEKLPVKCVARNEIVVALHTTVVTMITAAGEDHAVVLQGDDDVLTADLALVHAQGHMKGGDGVHRHTGVKALEDPAMRLLLKMDETRIETAVATPMTENDGCNYAKHVDNQSYTSGLNHIFV